jgi:adenylate kinase family enzyme
MNSKVFLLLNGVAGAGKGTIAQNFIDYKDFNSIQVGNFLREYIQSPESDINRVNRIKPKIEAGLLADFEDWKFVVEPRILLYNSEDVLTDGLVRTTEQAYWFVNFANKIKQKIFYIDLYVSEQEVLRRLNNRFFVPGNVNPFQNFEQALKNCPKGVEPIRRSDDLEESVVKNRIKIHNESKVKIKEIISESSLIHYYEINSERPVAEVYNTINAILT